MAVENLRLKNYAEFFFFFFLQLDIYLVKPDIISHEFLDKIFKVNPAQNP